MRKAAALVWIWMLAGALVLAQTSPSNPSHEDTRRANPETGEPQAKPVAPAAQDQGPGATDGVIVAAGSEIRATLDTPLSSKTSRPGDRFTATIQEPVRAADGGIAIPSGAQIHGAVTEAEAGRSVPNARAGGRLNLHFQEVVLRDGIRLPLAATLVSVRSTNGTPPRSSRVPSAAGAIDGLSFDSSMKGVSTADGRVRGSDGNDVNLPANSGVVLRLEQPLNVPKTTAAGK